VSAFAEALRHNSVIEKIVIKDTDSAEGYDKLAFSIRENRKNNIKHIDLSDNRILCGDYTIHCIAYFAST
jgi:hypothetical protein